ncbi:MAG: YqeG family HAD IIIA-type phosphatase [Clostridia bacterium]|nr:YqeG family HAD IIIA-type phosphatase [Clostridia bacterium]
MSLFFPTLYRRRITDVTMEDLRRLDAACILLDVDNTLTTHDAPDLTDAVKAWLDEVSEAGLSLIVVSNNSAERVAPFAQKIGLPYYAHARKPLPFGFRSAAKLADVPCKRCVAIGDQIFTDILGANLAGMPSILLEPIQLETKQKFIVFKRKIERPMLNSRKQMARREQDYGKR